MGKVAYFSFRACFPESQEKSFLNWREEKKVVTK